MDPVSDTGASSAESNVRLAQSVIKALQALPQAQAAAVAAAIRRIGKEPGIPLELQHSGGAPRQYLAAVPADDVHAPVVVYRELEDREGGGYLVTGLSDRDTFSAYERPRPDVLGAGSVVADHGGAAVGQLGYQRSATPTQPVRLAPRPAMLAGREELLAELDARLSGPVPRMVVLSGLGGVGKTCVALEYAYRHLAEVGVAWQLSAENSTVLAAEFGELSAQLGGGSGDPVAAVHGALADSPAPWLLVFDNAPDRASVARFVPPAGPGRVLITSRNQIWPPGQALDVRGGLLQRQRQPA